MNHHILMPVIFAFLVGPNPVFAEDGVVTILSPADGAMVEPGNKIEVKYDATPGADGNHLHLYVDGKRVDVIRQFKGAAMVDVLPSGKHTICMTVNTKWHIRTGIENCVGVTTK